MPVLFFELTTLLFYGVFSQQPDLIQAGRTAWQELAERGYKADGGEPVRIYPGGAAEMPDAPQSGGWRPGVITLRTNPKSSFSEASYLRHELMHEAGHRTCGDKLPKWAEEAAAIAFSGEAIEGEAPGDDEILSLREASRINAPLKQDAYHALQKLAGAYGWPAKPCEVSQEIAQQIKGTPVEGGAFSFVLISALSGRMLEQQGTVDDKAPPGSLLKIPYAAALNLPMSEDLTAALAKSDTEKLASLRSHVNSTLLCEMLGIDLPDDSASWRSILGERRPDGSFAYEASLPSLAMLEREALIRRPEMFAGLERNGEIEGSTLERASAREKKVLEEMHALVKTGTIGTSEGRPLMGHILIAWPAKSPEYLIIARKGGVSGAHVLDAVLPYLERWRKDYEPGSGRVRVRLFKRLDDDQFELHEQCRTFPVPGQNPDETATAGRCGAFEFTTRVKSARAERVVRGVLHKTKNGTVLETDPETYADSVLEAEADGLHGEAEKALRAVVVWNGLHGSDRHPETHSLCDTTHCMVFLGSDPAAKPSKGRRTDPALIHVLDRIASTFGTSWFPFSRGGNEGWQMTVTAMTLARTLDEQEVLAVQRERTRQGDVRIHLTYAGSAEIVPCEIFRNRLKLLSCPESISRNPDGSWLFEGTGEGHGEGLNVSAAEGLAKSGASAEEILRRAFTNPRNSSPF